MPKFVAMRISFSGPIMWHWCWKRNPNFGLRKRENWRSLKNFILVDHGMLDEIRFFLRFNFSSKSQFVLRGHFQVSPWKTILRWSLKKSETCFSFLYHRSQDGSGGRFRRRRCKIRPNWRKISRSSLIWSSRGEASWVSSRILMPSKYHVAFWNQTFENF